jgi:hypothetical protein
LECIYPTKADQTTRRLAKYVSSDQAVAKYVSSDQAVANISMAQPFQSTSESLNFTLTDLRFFHHFLNLARPHLPLGNDNVWVEQIPIFAQEVGIDDCSGVS